MLRFTASMAIGWALLAAHAGAQDTATGPAGLEINSTSARAIGATPYPSQMAARTGAGWGATALLTIGESVRGYTPPGIPDGMYAFSKNNRRVRVLVNHELIAEAGYPYKLQNGTELTGARVSFFDIDSRDRSVTRAGLAYRKIYARNGESVTADRELFVILLTNRVHPSVNDTRIRQLRPVVHDAVIEGLVATGLRGPS